MYEKYPSYDLSDRKDFIKGTVKEVKTFSYRKHSGFFCVLVGGGGGLCVSGFFGCAVLVFWVFWLWCFGFFQPITKSGMASYYTSFNKLLYSIRSSVL